MTRQLRFDQRGGTLERHSEIEVANRRERAVDRIARSVVAAQRVDRDPDQELLLFDRARLPAAIVAAVRTDAMWRLRLVAMGALAQPRGLERVVRPALGRARLGVSSLWVWHSEL